jgi:hypothetical protein
VKTESKGDSACKSRHLLEAVGWGSLTAATLETRGLTSATVNQDPMDPKFDVESYLTALFAKEGL